MGNGEGLRGVGYQLAVHVYGELGVGLQAHRRGPVLVDGLVADKIPALHVAGHPDQVPMPPELYGVDVEEAVVDSGAGGHHHPPAVEAPVAHGDLQEPPVLGRLVVAVREGEPGREGLVA